jgi:uncharacterized protein
MPELVILIFVGVIAGIMSGMFGIGGGAIIVPALMIFLGYSQTMANGTSLAALLLPVAIFACISYYRAGKLNPRIAALVAIGLLSGIWFGANIAQTLEKINPAILRISYGGFLVYQAWRNIAPRQWWAERQGKPKEPDREETKIKLTARVMIMLVLVGILAGILAGMFGIGGGVIIVLALTSWLKFDQKMATGTSLGALLLPVGLPGVLVYSEAGDLNLNAAAVLAVMLALSSVLGARLTLSLSAKTVRRAYGVFLLFVGLRFLVFA